MLYVAVGKNVASGESSREQVRKTSTCLSRGVRTSWIVVTRKMKENGRAIP